MRPTEVAVAAVVCRRGRVLVGHRINSVAPNVWSCPGGVIAPGETVEAAVKREVWEETRLLVRTVTPLPAWHEATYDGHSRHHVILFVKCEVEPGEVVLVEPHKCAEWRWASPLYLPEPFINKASEELLKSLCR